MFWPIVKKLRYPILGCLALIIFLSVVDPLLVALRRSSEKRSQAESQYIPRWRWFTNRDCGYVVEFPAKPFENPYTLSSTQKVKSYRQFAAALGNDHAFMVATLVPSCTNTFTEEQTKMLFSLTAASDGKATRPSPDHQGSAAG